MTITDIEEFKESLKIIEKYSKYISNGRDIKKDKEIVQKVINKLDRGEYHKVFITSDM